MAPLRISFLIMSVYDLLPSSANLVRWGKKDDPTCPLCQGVQSGFLPDHCTQMDAFLCLFTEQIVDGLVVSINNYAQMRCLQNNPPRKRSRFGNRYPVTQAELYKFFAVVTLIGLDPKPATKDIWSRSWYYLMPAFHQLFYREKFLSIFQTKDTGLPESETRSARKI
ncbi:PiggyBac transposable element-derived protein 4 [Plakobranchus ocellatus]|uniref:PiggyBac transposable element-derived protein 4 n=1 Tax=Plakobranchus ocellatus TaxID=259542 RepID=A0AAV4C4X2_9GAST|nr:PiggyBac transposable element-derived protein 4 [Plakobranchus ocellatus]